jgi:BirA family biotin operon repressor/biotin-[acetyl-CoA-carboxylase] ligase
VHSAAADLPPGATSLRLARHPNLDRTTLLLELLQKFQARFQTWCDHAGDAETSGLATAYRARCATIGQRVRAELAGSPVTGRASGIDAAGRLIIDAERAGDCDTVIAAGDVTHVRPEPAPDAGPESD